MMTGSTRTARTLSFWGRGLLCLLALARISPADEIILKNGLSLRGNAIDVAGMTLAVAKFNRPDKTDLDTSFIMLDDGVRCYFVHKRQVAQRIAEQELSRYVNYKIEHQKQARTSGLGVVGGFQVLQPFDQFGRREIRLNASGREFQLLQEITELRPDFARIQTSKFVWDFCLDTRILPPELVQRLIEKNSDREDPAERKAALQFYLQAEMFPEALSELDRLLERFPELASWAERPREEIYELQARRGIHEIQRRRDAGQHRLAYQIARQFPTEHVSADVQREAREVVEEYDQALSDRDQILMQLDMLQAELPEEQSQRLHSIRATLINELHYESLPRLKPFLQVAEETDISSRQKLALAYSGWLLGSENAIEDLDATLRLWNARFLAIEYLRNEKDSLRDTEILKQLDGIEGINVPRLAQMIPYLPLPVEAPSTVPVVPQVIDLPPVEGQPGGQYTIALPPEYNPAHEYPLLIELKGEGRTYEQAVKWWMGDEDYPGWAQRRGYIVLAPHYCSESATEFNGNAIEHAIVLQSIDHARKRFRIDSNRIFLAGHGMGGNACFDIAFSHPHIFAGAIPFTGYCHQVCPIYYKNAPDLAWYVVGGERDRDTRDVNAPTINRMMRAQYDVVYCDYKSRGYETYHEEQGRIFDWMQTHRRAPLKNFAKFEAKTLRASDNEFYWFRSNQLPDVLFQPILWDQQQRKVPRLFEGTITASANIDPNRPKVTAIYVKHPGKGMTIWLSPELYDFDSRCDVHFNGRTLHSDYVKPSAQALLNDLRERGDRQRLFWGRLDL
ncbi:hypothetical protein [Planctomicrobium sp. SH664]|uniref:carboxylesterase family protein n=1 Tax=Planctomicrobium sp. SH664 TaxID=3448125 RepID=UPI003F5BDFDD